MMAVHAATLEELTEKVHQLEDQVRELQLALSRRGILDKGAKVSGQVDKPGALIRLLDTWAEGDEQEQQDTWDYLKHALDEDRPSNRKLFP